LIYVSLHISITIFRMKIRSSPAMGVIPAHFVTGNTTGQAAEKSLEVATTEVLPVTAAV
jgi:hypothetical protein